MSLLKTALERIDAIHAEDPTRVSAESGPIAKELLYAQRMSRWLHALESNPSEALELACRAQHIRRWESARSDYPSGRAGYKAWRADLLKRHAATTEALMREVGYGEEACARVACLLKKLDRNHDKEAQALEDVACLVFLAHEFDDFAAKHADDKLISIVQKTWKKMSARAQEAASALTLSDRGQSIVQRALH